MEDVQKIRLILLGGDKVGKTSLMHSILEGSILEVNPINQSDNQNSNSFPKISTNPYKYENLENNYCIDLNNSPINNKTLQIQINTNTVADNSNKSPSNSNNNLTKIENNKNNNESTICNNSTTNITMEKNEPSKTARNNSSENVFNYSDLTTDEISSKSETSRASIKSLNTINNYAFHNIPNSIQKNIQYKDKTYRITLYDSVSLTNASNQFFDGKSISEIQGFILVFALDDEISFETIQHVNNLLISKVGFKYVPRVLVGNKADLSPAIEKERITKLKNKLICPYVECSVKEGNNLDKILVKILKEINKEYNDEHPYDILNANRELNCISRQANHYKNLLNVLFCAIIVRK